MISEEEISQELSQFHPMYIDESISTDLSEPNTEVFNYRALNPTVEVYIDCTNYDASGSCVNNTENK